MTNLVLVIGRSGSGKSTLERGLLEKYPDYFHKVVSVTTRPQRKGESNGVDYHFMNVQEFKHADLIERETFGSNSYGSFRFDYESLKKYTVFVMVPGVLNVLKKTLEENVPNVERIIIVYFDITTDRLYRNMRTRGDTPEYALDRLDKDNIDKEFIKQGIEPDITIDDCMLDELLIDKVFNSLEKRVEVTDGIQETSQG